MKIPAITNSLLTKNPARKFILASTIALMTATGANAINQQTVDTCETTKKEIVNNDGAHWYDRVLGGLFVLGLGAIAYGTHRVLHPNNKVQIYGKNTRSFVIRSINSISIKF